MADPTDPTARAITSGARPAPDAYPVVPGQDTAGQLRGAAADEHGYRPLSVTAVAGLALAGLYALFVVVACLVAWARGTSLLMSVYWLLWPAAALVVSALAWVQVQRSEGTRAGGRLAVWGMALSGLFGLGYSAYYAAVYLALQLQAEREADRWIALIREAKLDEAFLRTLPPTERPTSTGADLHRELELRFNSAQDGSPHGPLAAFEESPMVRLLNHGGTWETGADSQVRSTGVRTWEYKEGGYRFELGYVVTTPEREIEVKITLHGTEGKHKQADRQWAVLARDSEPISEVRERPLGPRIAALRDSSRDFLENWAGKLSTGRLEDAYLDTQAPARRDELSREYQARLALAALAAPGADPAAAGPLANAELGRRLYLPGYRDFRAGGVVSAGPEVFWADGPLQQTIPDAVKKMFELPRPLGSMVPQKAILSRWWREGDQVRLTHGFQLMVGDHEYAVVGELVAATDARALEQEGAPVWQLAAVELHHGRTMVPRQHMIGIPLPDAPPPRP